MRRKQPAEAVVRAPKRIRRPLQCRRGNPTHPFAIDGWSGRTAPRSPGQPPTGRDRAFTAAVLRTIPADELEAQIAACQLLVRACRQAIDDLTLDADARGARSDRTLAILRDVLADWSDTLATIRFSAKR